MGQSEICDIVCYIICLKWIRQFHEHGPKKILVLNNVNSLATWNQFKCRRFSGQYKVLAATALMNFGNSFSASK